MLKQVFTQKLFSLGEGIKSTDINEISLYFIAIDVFTYHFGEEIVL